MGEREGIKIRASCVVRFSESMSSYLGILGYLKKKKNFLERPISSSPEPTPATKASVAITRTAKGITHLFECIARSATTSFSSLGPLFGRINFIRRHFSF